jgi:multicomponent Na+:H+ antiporter subunit E
MTDAAPPTPEPKPPGRARKFASWRPTAAGHIITVTSLAFAWCGLWDDLSVTNLVVGTLLGIAIVAAGFGTSGANGVRLVPLARLLWLVATDLATSTASVAWEVLTPTDYTEEAIIAVDIAPGSRTHYLLLAVAITLTPGTAVVDIEPNQGIIYLHLLHYEKAEETRAHTIALAELSRSALPQGKKSERAQ